MKKFIATAIIFSTLYSCLAYAEITFLSLDGAARNSERTITSRLQSAGFQVAPISTMSGQSGVILHIVSAIDRNTTGQGNLVANHGGSATVIYMCDTKTARIPIFIGDQATTGVSLGYDANNIGSQSETSLLQIATQVLKRSTAKIEEWTTYCANTNAIDSSASELPPKKKKK